MAFFVFALPVIASADAPQLPGWWPLPPGWWLLGLALFLGLLWMAYLFLRRFIRAAKARAGRILPVRNRAMAALDELEHRRPLVAREAAYRLNEILQAALPGEPGMAPPFPVSGFTEKISKLSPVSSPVSIDDQAQWQRFWQELAMRYRPAMAAGDADIKRWIAQARVWIEQLPPDDGAHGSGNGTRR